MAAGRPNRRDRLGAQFVGELAQAGRGRACADRRASRPRRAAVCQGLSLIVDGTRSRPAMTSRGTPPVERQLSVALAAPAANLDHRADIGEKPALRAASRTPPVRLVVVDMRRLAAIVADQEDAVVQAVGMVVGDIGVGAFDPAGEVGADEQVEDAVDAVGGDAAAAGSATPSRRCHRPRPAGRSSPARRTRRRASASIARPTSPSWSERRRQGRRRCGCDGHGPWRNVGLRRGGTSAGVTAAIVPSAASANAASAIRRVRHGSDCFDFARNDGIRERLRSPRGD